MGDKNKKYYKSVKKPEQAGEKAVFRVKNEYRSWLGYALLGSIVIVTFWCYHYSLKNEFTNWDDDRFIPQNIFIKLLSAANLKMMMFHDVTGDYYNPLTLISYSINYHFSRMSPQLYYLTNIIIHILSSCLVFFLVQSMLKAMEKKGYGIFKWKEWMAFFCAMAFAIHPMHVESVSWIAERKDVLYGLFYFAGMMAYVKYIAKSEEQRVKNNKSIPFFLLPSYFLVLSLYLLSLLSKPMAMVFPFSLLCIDVLLKRDKTTSVKNIVFEKLPFILITALSVITTYHSEKLSGAAIQHQSGLFQRILFASYSFYMYIVKAIVPIPLSSYYPYPDTGPSGYLPFIFYVSPFIALLLAAIPLYLSYRSGENNFRLVLFGLGFYFFNMVMVSKIIDSGPYLLADRYTYVCYFGIFFPATYFIYKIFQKGNLVKKITTAVISVYLLFFAVLCYQRTLVWHNSETLWTDVIKKYPHRIGTAYLNLGLYYYFEHRDFDIVYDNYREAIKLSSNSPKVYCDMGLLMCGKKLYDSALDYFAESIKADSNYADAYMERGTAYAKMGRYDLAMKNYRHSLSLNPYSEALWENFAFTWLKAEQYDSSIAYYNHLIQINPTLYGYFHCRGLSEYYKGDTKPAMEDFIQNLNMAPHDSECMYYLSMSYKRINDFDNAYKYAQMAQSAKYPVPNDYMRLIKDRLGIP